MAEGPVVCHITCIKNLQLGRCKIDSPDAPGEPPLLRAARKRSGGSFLLVGGMTADRVLMRDAWCIALPSGRSGGGSPAVVPKRRWIVGLRGEGSRLSCAESQAMLSQDTADSIRATRPAPTAFPPPKHLFPTSNQQSAFRNTKTRT